jgi:predicted O-linked N-acetylglucosamine transferase (SPINDLY family)
MIILNKEEFEIREKLLLTAIKDKNHVNAINDIASFYLQNKFYHKSRIYFKKILKIKKDDPYILNNLGTISFFLKDFTNAEKYFLEAINIKRDYINALLNLALTYYNLEKFPYSLFFYKKVLILEKNNYSALRNILKIFYIFGKLYKFKIYFDIAIKYYPNDLLFHFLDLNIFPIIYNNNNEILKKRTDFINKLLFLKKFIKTNIFSEKEIYDTLIFSNNFYLPYQGIEIRNIQREYSDIIEYLSSKLISEKSVPEFKITKNNKKKRIGFICHFFYEHTVLKLFLNWILKLDKKKFEIYIYYTNQNIDYVTENLKSFSFSYFQSTNIIDVLSTIKKDSLDTLIYLELGMFAGMQVIAPHKLAKKQIVSWGHPVTSGYKSIDYFFSSLSMELENSQKNYNEKLILLDGLGISPFFDFSRFNNLSKRNNHNGKVIFFNIQSLFKLLPEDDDIYLDIYKRFPNSMFCFIKNKHNLVTNKFIYRLKQNLGKNFVNNNCLFHDKVSNKKFLELVNSSDIILDSLKWSGGISSLEAIYLNKPIVTLPSELLQSRHTYGILKILEINELIANNKENYISIAVELAKNLTFREFVINKIKENKKKIFNIEKNHIENYL